MSSSAGQQNVTRGRRKKDLTGQRFGRLTALYRLDKKRGSSYLWRCRCDCGKETDASVSTLVSGNTRSCGCIKLDSLHSRAKDIAGRRFGWLTALRKTEKRMQGSVVWQCRCDCGTMCEVAYNSLISGNTASCGCKKTKHAQPLLHYIDGTCIEMIDHPILRSDNTSGCTGVVAVKGGRWRAEITFRGRRHILGVYDDISLAAEARRRAEEQFFGEYLGSYRAGEGAAAAQNII